MSILRTLRAGVSRGLAAAVLAWVVAPWPVPAMAQAHRHWHSRPEAVAALRLLREGGNVVFIRHAKTDALAKDEVEGEWSDCAWQRNLSASGRSASHEMGEALRLLSVPVGEVRSSPYCRCMDTAWRAFGRAEPDPALAPRPGSAPGAGMGRAGAALLTIAERGAPRGTNVFVVGHIFNAPGAVGAMPEEGEALLLRRDDQGRIRSVGRLTMTQWGDLVRDVLVFGLDPETDTRELTGAHHRPHSHREP